MTLFGDSFPHWCISYKHQTVFRLALRLEKSKPDPKHLKLADLACKRWVREGLSTSVMLSLYYPVSI